MDNGSCARRAIHKCCCYRRIIQRCYRSNDSKRHISNIEQRVLPAVTVLPYDIGIAKVFGSIRAHLEDTGMILPDADIQIAATAIGHNLELITGNVRHFKRISGLNLNHVLANSRKSIWSGSGLVSPESGL